VSAGARPHRHVLPPDRLLVGTHWTALEPQPERHFELRAVAREALRDATRWARDWRSLPDEVEPSHGSPSNAGAPTPDD
jgi:hypothetical protein